MVANEGRSPERGSDPHAAFQHGWGGGMATLVGHNSPPPGAGPRSSDAPTSNLRRPREGSPSATMGCLPLLQWYGTRPLPLPGGDDGAQGGTPVFTVRSPEGPPPPTSSTIAVAPPHWTSQAQYTSKYLSKVYFLAT